MVSLVQLLNQAYYVTDWAEDNVSVTPLTRNLNLNGQSPVAYTSKTHLDPGSLKLYYLFLDQLIWKLYHTLVQYIQESISKYT